MEFPMRKNSPVNSTNVRFRLRREGAGPLLAALLWIALGTALAASGALERLGSDTRVLLAVACAIAALAYGVDAELRATLERAATTGVALAFTLLACAGAWIALATWPVAVVLLAALVRRAAGVRFSSRTAASPGARPGAP
jgi:hypothetical protein